MYRNVSGNIYASKEERVVGKEYGDMGGSSVGCILPPHMLKEISKKGSQKQKDMALRTLLMSEKIRGRREAFAEVYVATSIGTKCIRVYDAKNLQDLPGEEVLDPAVPAALRPLLQFLSKY